MYMLLYVDDILLMGPNIMYINHIKTYISKEFEMKDLGKNFKILGMNIIRKREQKLLYISQQNYLINMLKTFDMLDFKFNSLYSAARHNLNSKNAYTSDTLLDIPYTEAIRSLMYIRVFIRLDIAYSISILSRFLIKISV